MPLPSKKAQESQKALQGAYKSLLLIPFKPWSAAALETCACGLRLMVTRWTSANAVSAIKASTKSAPTTLVLILRSPWECIFVVHASLLVPRKTPLLAMRRFKNKLPMTNLRHLRTSLPHHLPTSLPHLPKSLPHLPTRSGGAQQHPPTRRLPHRRKRKMHLPLLMIPQKDVAPKIGNLRRP